MSVIGEEPHRAGALRTGDPRRVSELDEHRRAGRLEHRLGALEVVEVVRGALGSVAAK
jgi:hypothetical protein